MREHCAHTGLLAAATPFALPGAKPHYAADRPVRALHVRLEVSLDFDRKAIDGVCTTKVTAVREVAAFAFDAVEMEVARVLVGGARAEVESTGEQLWVRPRRPLRAGATA